MNIHPLRYYTCNDDKKPVDVVYVTGYGRELEDVEFKFVWSQKVESYIYAGLKDYNDENYMKRFNPDWYMPLLVEEVNETDFLWSDEGEVIRGGCMTP